MQINNWADLLKNKRLAKTPRDLNNDLVIIGTNTQGNLKKQDTWQPYAMTLADLASAIGGGGGGGVNFKLQSLSTYIELTLNTVPQSGAFTPTENSIVGIDVVSVPNGLRWRGEYTAGTPGDGQGEYLINDVVYVDNGSSYTTWFARTDQDIPNTTPPPSSGYSNTDWGQLGDKGDNGYRTAVLEMYKWSATAPATYPSGASVYTWSTGSWTPPATLNGWSQTIPAPVAGQFLWKVKMIHTDNLIDPSVSISWTATSSESITYAGQDGTSTVNAFPPAGGSFTLPAGTKGNMYLLSTTAASMTITIPTLDDTAFPVGAQVMFVWHAGSLSTTINFSAGASSTINVADNMLYLRTIQSAAVLTKISYSGGATVWHLTGDLTNVI